MGKSTHRFFRVLHDEFQEELRLLLRRCPVISTPVYSQLWIVGGDDTPGTNIIEKH